ncbi:hypothetical protein PV463_43365, partial [Streptomyces scabiei]|nr:hypothetical protein [Streptomyces scabiei]
QAVRCLPLPRRDHAPHTTKPLLTEQGLPLPQRTESKRSAIFNLARILEERRALIKEHLHKKDEGALFQIANSFDLRHSNAGQQREYDEAFLDWIFWWYLATVELTNRLIASRTTA